MIHNIFYEKCRFAIIVYKKNKLKITEYKMSTRRAQSMPPTAYDKIPKERGRCVAAICVSWKVFTCIFSHAMLITLVVAYCIIGAITFEHLEAANEVTVCTNS